MPSKITSMCVVHYACISCATWNQDTFGESGGSGWSSFRLCLVVAIFRSEAMRCQEGLRAERARAQYGSPLGSPLS